jgi:hypothetical protein
MSQPVKRGPGRPRKQPAPGPAPEVTPDTVAADVVAEEPDKPAKKNDDPRIGMDCDPSWSSVGYDDGSTYRCEGGKLVERVL